jgi:hypothetical protein
MAMRRSYSDHGERYSAATISATVASEREIPESCGDRSASRRRTRWISARERRVIARWLRRTADVAPDPHPILRRQDPLLHGRAAAVHGELLELAALVERVDDPDPACMAELHSLLADGCDSPLYNSEIHVSELRATLYWVRARLVMHT